MVASEPTPRRPSRPTFTAPARAWKSARSAGAARAGAVVLEAALWASLAVVLLTRILRPILGPAMLGLGQGPYWGLGASVPARLSDATWRTAVEQMGGTVPPALVHGLSGGPAGRGEHVEATLPTGVEISVWEPMTFRQLVGVAGAELLGGLVLAAAFLLVIAMVRDLRRGALFTNRNLRRVYSVAAVAGIGGMLAEIAGAWGRIGVLQSPPLAGAVDVTWTISFVPLLIGLGIAVGAEILRLGTQLQHEVEGLV
ncbi:Protein of unknown function (DUF2975) [Georgenia soli]|uniref:DUF2975 family protein n=1 Tax=Georgenia soli TaxID=638953 RepID=A0A2A9F313_9MICO|nr:DUF2975 domain-containing protein [Georgenia soli]PFG44900.1 Protein of unknown function (DUF2975) [Georgenia soli]